MFVSLEALIGFNLKSRDVRDGQYLLPYDIKYATSSINASCVIQILKTRFEMVFFPERCRHPFLIDKG